MVGSLAEPSPRTELDFIHSRKGEVAQHSANLRFSWILSCAVIRATRKNRSHACNVHYSGRNVYYAGMSGTPAKRGPAGTLLQRYMCWLAPVKARALDKVEHRTW